MAILKVYQVVNPPTQISRITDVPMSQCHNVTDMFFECADLAWSVTRLSKLERLGECYA